MVNVWLLAGTVTAGSLGLCQASCDATRVTQSECPSTAIWDDVSGHCFWSRGKASHAVCEMNCNYAGGGALATISSRRVNSIVFDQLMENEDYAWIGLYQTPGSEGSAWGWDSWMNGCSTTFRNWHSDPDDWCGLQESCAFMKKGDSDGFDLGDQWQDATCTNEFSCICEYPGATTVQYKEAVNELEIKGEFSEECAEGIVIAILFSLIVPVCGCCCYCLCGCGVGWYFYNRSKQQQRQREQQQQQGGQPGYGQGPQAYGQPVAVGQPVVGTIVS